MANNRLYILDPETGERFMLAKTMGLGWYNHQFRGYVIGSWRDVFLKWCARLVGARTFLDRLEEWLEGKDSEACIGNCFGARTKLRLVTEHEGGVCPIGSP